MLILDKVGSEAEREYLRRHIGRARTLAALILPPDTYILNLPLKLNTKSSDVNECDLTTQSFVLPHKEIEGQGGWLAESPMLKNGRVGLETKS